MVLNVLKFLNDLWLIPSVFFAFVCYIITLVWKTGEMFSIMLLQILPDIHVSWNVMAKVYMQMNVFISQLFSY